MESGVVAFFFCGSIESGTAPGTQPNDDVYERDILQRSKNILRLWIHRFLDRHFLFQQIPGIVRYIFYCGAQEEANIFALVSSHNRVVVLLVFLQTSIATVHVFCGHEFLCPCHNVRILFFDDKETRAEMV